MPITKQTTVSHVLMKLSVDMATMSTLCYFHRFVDGEVDGGFEMPISGPDMAELLSTPAKDGQPIGGEVTNAIYQYAVSKGLIVGEIS